MFLVSLRLLDVQGDIRLNGISRLMMDKLHRCMGCFTVRSLAVLRAKNTLGVGQGLKLSSGKELMEVTRV
jgi:hypothetical protein